RGALVLRPPLGGKCLLARLLPLRRLALGPIPRLGPGLDPCLGLGMALCSSAPVPEQRLRFVPSGAPTFLVHLAEFELGLGLALLGQPGLESEYAIPDLITGQGGAWRKT